MYRGTVLSFDILVAMCSTGAFLRLQCPVSGIAQKQSIEQAGELDRIDSTYIQHLRCPTAPELCLEQTSMSALGPKPAVELSIAGRQDQKFADYHGGPDPTQSGRLCIVNLRAAAQLRF